MDYFELLLPLPLVPLPVVPLDPLEPVAPLEPLEPLEPLLLMPLEPLDPLAPLLAASRFWQPARPAIKRLADNNAAIVLLSLVIFISSSKCL